MDRREFVQTGAALAVASRLPIRLPQADASIKELCMRALSTAKTAGASYADIRVARTRSQSVNTREQQITNLSDGDTFGFGIRVLAQGAWGFAASRDLSAAEVDRVARLAVSQAKANRRALRKPVTLAPTPAVKDGAWRSPIETDPFDISVEDKVALLLRANAEALKAGARFVNSSLAFVRDQKTYASTDDIFAVQDDLTDCVVATVADTNGVLLRSMAASVEAKLESELTAGDWVLKYYGYRMLLTPEEHAKLRDGLERFAERESRHDRMPPRVRLRSGTIRDVRKPDTQSAPGIEEPE